MRHLILISILVALFNTSCKKENNSSRISSGIYKGTFQRKMSNGGQISNVTIDFSAGTWSGISEFEKYPALCRGTFSVNGLDSLRFENDCPWTAEFDWTLILAQSYKIKIEGNDIELTREYNNSYTDIYKLTKQ